MRSLFILISISFIGLMFTSCRKSEETNRYPLSEEDLNFVPYEASATVPFRHSRGFEFSFAVQKRHNFWDRSEIEHTGDDYISFQVEETILMSREPELEITISLFPEEFSDPIGLNINRHEFKLYNRTEPGLDSLEINGKVYREIFVFRKDDFFSSTAIVPDSILYTRNEGIINIKMTNDEEYFLDL